MKRLAAILAVLLALILAVLPWAVPTALNVIVREFAARLRIPLEGSSRFGYGWSGYGPCVRLSAEVSLIGTNWRVLVDGSAGLSHYEAKVCLPPVAFSEKDPLLAEMFRRYSVDAVSNLTVCGVAEMELSVKRTWRFPVPEWEATVPLRHVSASCESKGVPINICDANLTLQVRGIADRVSPAPARLRMSSASYGVHELTNIHVSAWTGLGQLFVSEAVAGYCDGKVRLYSAYFDYDDLDAGVTVGFEDVDAGAAMRAFTGFRGRATGRLNGRMPIRLRKGERIHFGNAILYSPPGEIGKITLQDSESFCSYLALAGVDESTRSNVANVMADVDYSVLRLTLFREGEGLAAKILMSGTATRDATTVPVTLDLTLRGDFENLINAGFKLTGRKERNK